MCTPKSPLKNSNNLKNDCYVFSYLNEILTNEIIYELFYH